MKRIPGELITTAIIAVVLSAGYVIALNLFAYYGVGGGYITGRIARARALPGTDIMVPQAWAQDGEPRGYFWFPPNGPKFYAHPSGSLKVPAGYIICPHDVPITHNATIEDVKESTKCRDGHLLTPACTAGTISYLCNPHTGLKIEQISPSRAEDGAGADPLGYYTEPHK